MIHTIKIQITVSSTIRDHRSQKYLYYRHRRRSWIIFCPPCQRRSNPSSRRPSHCRKSLHLCQNHILHPSIFAPSNMPLSHHTFVSVLGCTLSPCLWAVLCTVRIEARSDSKCRKSNRLYGISNIVILSVEDDSLELVLRSFLRNGKKRPILIRLTAETAVLKDSKTALIVACGWWRNAINYLAVLKRLPPQLAPWPDYFAPCPSSKQGPCLPGDNQRG